MIELKLVFQSFNLFGHLTVIENLMLAPMDILKKTKREAYERGVELLKRVGLAGREYQYPDQLSGGQKQRVAIDRGQLEAAYTLGYTNLKAFFRIILPQALPHFMPAYKASITEIIKATAIVGYVAVQDLTKMGDIVRSRTYEAFFPLIAVAVIYFILAAVLTFFVNRIELRIDKRKRTPEQIRKEAEETA